MHRLSSYYIVLFFFSILGIEFVHSQDVHYSHRMVQDRARNPVFLNDFDGKWQAHTDYRQQWASIGKPFVSSTAQLVRNIRSLNTPWNFFGSLGFTNDQSGDIDLQMSQISLQFGASYETDYGTFEAGLGNHFVLKSLNLTNVSFPEQYDRTIGRFNEALPNSENIQAQSINYLDWSLGLGWNKEINQSWTTTAGFYINHLTEPQESFLAGDNRKNRAWGVQLLGQYKKNESQELEPYFSMYRAQGASETILGLGWQFRTVKLAKISGVKPFAYFRTGVGRNTDAFILGSRMQVSNFDIGLSYDLNISDLELASNYQGGFEISLFYQIDYARIKEWRLPCVRY